VKRFAVTGIVRDKEYAVTKGSPGSKLLYFTANENGEAEIIKVSLKPKPRLKKLSFDFDFADLTIKGRSSQGNILSKNAVKKIIQAEKGFSTLGARDIWYDDTVMRINTDQRGRHLGAFKQDDRILTVTRSGFYRLMSFELSNHFDEDMILIEKFRPEKPITAIYYNPQKNSWFIKRFLVELSDKKVSFIPDDEGTKLETISSDFRPVLRVEYNNEGLKKPVETPQDIEAENFVEMMGVKAKGKKLGNAPVLNLEWLDSLPYDTPEIEMDVEVGGVPVVFDQETEEGMVEMKGDPNEIPGQIDESSIKPPPEFPDDEDDSGTGVQMTLF
jgi:topoisomerase-4 subunit A